jgi:hypothetical protein
MADAGELLWKGVRLYRAWQGASRHQYIGTLVENTGGWAAWAKGIRLGAWPGEAVARQALEEYAQLDPKPHNQAQYLKTIDKKVTR